MTAGVVSFKLCPFNYDCEHCDFDSVMRHQLKGEIPAKRSKAKKQSMSDSPSERANTFFTFSVGDFAGDCSIHLGHLWVRPLDKRTWQAGIDQLLSYVLPPPVRVELFDERRNVIQNEVFAQVVSTAGAVSLITPLSGTVVSTNPDLAAQPDWLQEDPLGKGWVAQIEWSQESSELKGFYTGTEATRFLQEEACHLRHILKYRGIEVNKIGETLPDGGSDIRYLHQILPAKFCIELSRVLVALGKAVW